MNQSQVQTNSDPLNTDEVNQAAYNFKEGLKLAKSMMGHKAISQKGMARVLNAILEFPLGDSEPKFKEKAEHHLFVLTIQCLSAKASMMQAMMNSKTQEASDGSNTETTEETT